MKEPINEFCDPRDVALKSLFLGPQSENGDWFTREVGRILQHTVNWRRSLYPNDGQAISINDQNDPEFQKLRQKLSLALNDLLRGLECETAKFTPRYIGHMVSETSLPGMLAEYAMLLHNPNNASPEVAKVGARIETEAIHDLAQMLGFNVSQSRGHFTSGGTLANFESVWRALHRFDRNLALAFYLLDRGRRPLGDYYTIVHSSSAQFDELFERHKISMPDLEAYSILSRGHWNIKVPTGIQRTNLSPVILVPGNKHYSWQKAALIFGLGLDSFWSIRLDAEGRLDIEDLNSRLKEARAQQRPVLMVVSVAGTTEMGEIDPVEEVQDLLDAQGDLTIWHHVDAAYGGFFAAMIRGAAEGGEGQPETLFGPTEKTRRALEALSRVASITIDPHKLGYIPYACGAFIARDSRHYECRQVEAPYLKKNPAVGLNNMAPNWATTLEGSRSAAGAAAVWLTSRCLSFDRQGLGRVLAKTFEARQLFVNKLSNMPEVCLARPSDTNVLCFCVARKSEKLQSVNDRSAQIFEKIEAGPDFSISRTRLSQADYGRFIARFCEQHAIQNDGSDHLQLRLVHMNPFICSKEMTTDFASEFAKTLESCKNCDTTATDETLQLSRSGRSAHKMRSPN